MAKVEPALASLCRQLNRMGRSLRIPEFLALANSIITDKPIEKEVIEYKRIVCGYKCNSSSLGVKYFKNFMNRHKDILHSTKPVRKGM